MRNTRQGWKMDSVSPLFRQILDTTLGIKPVEKQVIPKRNPVRGGKCKIRNHV